MMMSFFRNEYIWFKGLKNDFVEIKGVDLKIFSYHTIQLLRTNRIENIFINKN